ncbi:succinate dehydrogenase subunit C [Anaeromyxobacter dehalogenans 2CP-C]|uniref:Succinate dehydrogenase subunit C n=1 Tax=Anaeromyxobacter dehalogenans (strain 2CP-C) TaxID=290397 RepID=Q2IL76_ANADE|nr:succinate dehydrogenase subunit C [Anaeromyxobacter dehalogenans 2CP-C]
MAPETRPIARPVPRPSRAAALWSSTIGKKALMAVTGVVLFAYVVGHLLGNLQVFAGAARLDRYAELLRISPALLWSVRAVLLVAFLVHVAAGLQLSVLRREARPVAYATYRPVASTPAARGMIWSGLLILGFVVYHLLDLTIGVVNPDFRPGQVYHNVLATFGRGLGVAIYVVAMIALGFHLWHGMWSLFQSLGLATRRSLPGLQRFAVTVAWILALGFTAIPLAVVVGVVR